MNGVENLGDNAYSWLEEVLESKYKVEKTFKREDNVWISLRINTSNGRQVVVRKYEGDCYVYKKLVGIEHVNLPTVYEAVEDGGRCLVIEEYVEGMTVGDVLETGRYTAKGVGNVINQLVGALDVLHSNQIVHRDIKPENIMIRNDGVVKLIDYNISRVFEEESDRDTRVLGTTGFAAPEQYGFAQTDLRTDIYALGILINVMLTGEHPSKKICSGKWGKIVKRCTQINPDERFQSVREIKLNT